MTQTFNFDRSRPAVTRFLAACVLGAGSLAVGQTTVQLRDESVPATQERIKILNDKLREIKDTTQKQGNEMIAEMDTVMSQIHTEVDGFIVRTAKSRQPDLDKRGVERGLQQILPTANVEPRSVFLLNSANHRSLIVAYVLSKAGMMGPGGTSVTLRAYNETPRGIRLVDVTGENMNGFAGVSVTELHSSATRKLLLLLSGYMTGANGPNNRMRIYTFDGEKFRPIWTSENVWGTFTVKVTETGFTVEGDYYRDSRKRRDRYVVNEDGVTLGSSESAR